MGKSEGGHGSKSSGEPVSHEDAFPSPALFHTMAVGQSSVIACEHFEHFNILTTLNPAYSTYE